MKKGAKKYSIYQQRRIDALKKKAVTLYKDGLSLREVGNVITPKRSHEWVRKTLIEHGVKV